MNESQTFAQTMQIHFWRILDIALRDRTAFTELFSGLLLVLLRGLLLIGAPRAISEGSSVEQLLETIEITEARWGWFLAICGLIQVWYVDRKCSFVRVLVVGLIFFAFAAVAAGYYVAYHAFAIPPSLICMTVFYVVLLGRVGQDWWEARRNADCA